MSVCVDERPHSRAQRATGSALSRLPLFWLTLGCLLLATPGCVTEQRANPSLWGHDKVTLYTEEEALGFEPILGRYAVDPLFGSDLQRGERLDPSELFEPYHKYAHNTYLHSDGSMTLHYYLESGVGAKLAPLLVGQVKGLTFVGNNKAPTAPNQVSVFPNFVKDKRETSSSGPPSAFLKTKHQTDNACDLLLARVTNDTLVDVEKFIKKFLVEVPLIEVKVRILEVVLEDNMEYGISSRVTRESGGETLFKELTTHFNTEEMIAAGGFDLDDLDTWFDPARGDIDPGFQGGFFVVEGVHDKFRLQAALEILQRTSNSEVLSAPKIRILNGHKAIIETVSDRPIPKAVVRTTSTTYQYTYEPVGVTLLILPILLMDGTLQIQLTTEVSVITGEKNFTTGGGGSVTIPVIATRGASTVVNVKEDQAFMLAGLNDTSEIEVISKIPLLGDIPILGFLFKRKDIEKKKTQIIFYVEPRVIPPTEVSYDIE